MFARLPYRWIVAGIFVSAMFMSILDSTIVNVALPAVASDFGVNATEVEWVVTAYLVSLALWIPASGWIGDRFGSKRTFMLALVLFVAASATCGLAQELWQLVASRALQGAGGGMLVPIGTAMLFRAFPPEERARVSRVLLIPTAVAPASGPLIGGILVDNLSWHWVFLVNVPIGVLVCLFAWRGLKEHREPAAGAFDLPGFVLSGVGFALTLYAISLAPTHGWFSAPVLVTGAVGVLTLSAMVRVELRRAEPLLKLRLFADRLFRSANLASFFAGGAFVGTLFTIPIMLQVGRGLSAFESGSITFVEALGVIASSQVAGRLYQRVGPRRLVMGGLVVTGTTMVVFSTLDLQSSLLLIRLLAFTLGFGMGFIFVSIQASVFSTVSGADMGRASALYNAQRQSGPALAVSVVATVMATFGGDVAGDAGGGLDPAAYRAAFLASAVFAAIGFVFASRIRDADAAATMKPRVVPAADLDVSTEGPAPA